MESQHSPHSVPTGLNIFPANAPMIEILQSESYTVGSQIRPRNPFHMEGLLKERGHRVCLWTGQERKREKEGERRSFKFSYKVTPSMHSWFQLTSQVSSRWPHTRQITSSSSLLGLAIEMLAY